MTRWVIAIAVVTLALTMPAAAQAQGYFEFHNTLRPGVYSPWEGMNWNQRLNYGYDTSLWAWERGHTPAQIAQQLQYDRDERAARLQGQRLLWIDRPGPLFSRPPRFLRR
jgi:hypothetical protein